MDGISNNHRLFLQQHNNIQVNPPITKPPINSLKLLAISNLFKDADVEQLVQLRNYIDYELYNQGTNVKIVLSLYKSKFYRDGA